MASDNEKQPKTKSKKRRRIVVSETDSSDECDSPTVKTRRKQRINRIKNEIRMLSKRKDRELQAAGSSQNEITVKCEKNHDPRINGKIPSNDLEAELARSKLDSSVSETAKISNKVEIDEAVATSSRSDVNVENNDDNKMVDQCPICWTSFTNQEIGIPVCCKHCFCLQCLIEWSKNTNTCPVDRRIFTMIEVRESPSGIVMRSIPVETRNNNRENENSQSDENSSYYLDLFSSADEEMNSSVEENNERHPTLFPYQTDETDFSSLNSDTGDLWPPHEADSTDDDQLTIPTWPFDYASNSSSNREYNERNSSSNEENDERNYSSNQEYEERNSSFNQEDEERNSSSNQEDEERNYFSNREDEERNYCSSRDDDDDDERNLSSNQADAGSNSSSNRNDWPSSPNVDYYSTPDRINSSTGDDNNSDPDIRYSPSSVSAISNRSYTTSLTNSYSPSLQENHNSSDYLNSPTLSSASSPSSGSATSYSS